MNKKGMIIANNYSFVAKMVGEKVLKYDTVGSYQGEWFCIALTKANLIRIYIGSYGSCSGCDWLEATEETDYDSKIMNSYIKKSAAKEYRKDCKKILLPNDWKTLDRFFLLALIERKFCKGNYWEEDLTATIRDELLKIKKRKVFQKQSPVDNGSEDTK